MKYNELTLGQIEAIVNKLGGMDGVKRFLSSNVFNFVVNFALSLSDMIKAGAYDWVNPDITEVNFPKTGEGEVSVSAELVHLDRYVSSDDAVAEMDRLGFRQATIHELLSFGAKNPDVQREFPVVAALGSSCEVDGIRHMAFLDRDGSRRHLDLSWWNDGWHGRCRFLGVRK